MRNLTRLLRPTALQPWERTLYILFIAQVMSAVGFSSIFPFLPFYVQELGTSTGLSIEVLTGLVYSTQAFTMMLVSPFWGAVADRFGRKLMVERAMFGGAAILLWMAFAGSAEELVLQRTIQGLITGTIAAANALVAGQTPRQHSGFAMGLLQTGLGAGIAIGPLIGGAVADAYGYAAAFYITAAMLFLSGLLVLFGVPRDLPAEQPVRRAGSPFLQVWLEVARNRSMLLAYAMRFISSLGQMMVLPLAPLFAQALLTDQSNLNTFTGLVSGAASATTTISAIFLGRLGDRIGHRRILIVSLLAGVLFYLPHSLIDTGWQLLVLQALTGIAIGGITPSVSALLANASSAGQSGAVFGLENSIAAAARAIAPLLGAGLAGWFGLRNVFIWVGMIFLAAALLAAVALPKQAASTERQSDAQSIDHPHPLH